MKKILFVLLLISFVAAQNKDKYDQLVSQGVKQIYNLEFENAEKTFSQFKKEFPKHPAGKFFDAMVIWWKIMIDLDNEKYDDAFIDKLDDAIDYCEDLLDKNPNNADALFFKGGSLGFRGLLYSIRESWFKAAGDGAEALPIVTKVYKTDSTNVDVQLGFGIYNYFAVALPEQYPVIKPLMVFIPKGDKKKGLAQLDYAARKGKYAHYEARFTLLKLYSMFEKNYDKALYYANWLLDDFPNNPVFHRYLGQVQIKKYGYQMAGATFKDIYDRCNKGMFGYNKKVKREATYYLGVKSKLDKDIDQAIKYFEDSERLSSELDEDEESGFYINAVLYLGQLNDLKGNRAKAKKYYEKVLDMPDYGEAQSKAEQYLKNPYKL